MIRHMLDMDSVKVKGCAWCGEIGKSTLKTKEAYYLPRRDVRDIFAISSSPCLGQVRTCVKPEDFPGGLFDLNCAVGWRFER